MIIPSRHIDLPPRYDNLYSFGGLTFFIWEFSLTLPHDVLKKKKDHITRRFMIQSYSIQTNKLAVIISHDLLIHKLLMRFIAVVLSYVGLNSSESICLNLIIDEVREPLRKCKLSRVQLNYNTAKTRF